MIRGKMTEQLRPGGVAYNLLGAMQSSCVSQMRAGLELLWQAKIACRVCAQGLTTIEYAIAAL
jgi:hypothetical protein